MSQRSGLAVSRGSFGSGCWTGDGICPSLRMGRAVQNLQFLAQLRRPFPAACFVGFGERSVPTLSAQGRERDGWWFVKSGSYAPALRGSSHVHDRDGWLHGQGRVVCVRYGRPSSRARRMPARTRSMIRLRSSSAMAPTIVVSARPSGVAVSIASRKLTNSMFSLPSSSNTSIKCRTDLRQAVEAPYQQHIKLAPAGIGQQAIEPRPLGPGPADSVIDELFDDGEASAARPTGANPAVEFRSSDRRSKPFHTPPRASQQLLRGRFQVSRVPPTSGAGRANTPNGAPRLPALPARQDGVRLPCTGRTGGSGLVWVRFSWYDTACGRCFSSPASLG